VLTRNMYFDQLPLLTLHHMPRSCASPMLTATLLFNKKGKFWPIPTAFNGRLPAKFYHKSVYQNCADPSSWAFWRNVQQ